MAPWDAAFGYWANKLANEKENYIFMNTMRTDEWWRCVSQFVRKLYLEANILGNFGFQGFAEIWYRDPKSPPCVVANACQVAFFLKNRSNFVWGGISEPQKKWKKTFGKLRNLINHTETAKQNYWLLDRAYPTPPKPSLPPPAESLVSKMLEQDKTTSWLVRILFGQTFLVHVPQTRIYKSAGWKRIIWVKKTNKLVEEDESPGCNIRLRLHQNQYVWDCSRCPRLCMWFVYCLSSASKSKSTNLNTELREHGKQPKVRGLNCDI